MKVEGERETPSEQDLPTSKQSGGVQGPGSNHATGRGECARCLAPRLWLAGGSPEKERQNKSSVSPCHWSAMFTGVPAIHAALTWMVATPFAASEGIRKFTWYPSTAPG